MQIMDVFLDPHNRAALEAALELISRGRTVPFSIRSRSMRPLLKEKDLVFVAPAATRDLRRGDLVLTVEGGVPVLHRYMGRRNGFVLTKGDSSSAFDRPILSEKTAGRVSFLERGGRRYSMNSPRWALINKTAGILSYARGRLGELRAAAAAETKTREIFPVAVAASFSESEQ